MRCLLMLALACPWGSSALAQVPDWLAGPPDVRMHQDRAPLYRQVFEDVARRCRIEADEGSLARKRLIGAVNHAVEDWLRGNGTSYRAMLRYLTVADPDPRHCEFRLDSARIEEVLGPRGPGAASRKGASDERSPGA